ncbi:MAG: hypothetical protein J0H88_09205 [Sphingomonadales bacterium]|nr:hypothetical protein [Sphingomonadales bacterium]
MSIPQLKTILVADAVTCTGVLALGLFALTPVAALLGLPLDVVTIGAWICLAAALPMYLAAAQTVPSIALVKLIALGNLGWVAASFAVLVVFGQQMTVIGVGVVIGQALAVLAFAFLEWKGAAAPRAATA